MPSRFRHTAIGRQVLLVVGMLTALLVTFPVAYWLGGPQHVVSAAICAGVCWLGGAAAAGLRTKLSKPQQAFQALGLAIALRMIPPMILIGWAIFFRPGLDKQDAIYYLLIFYMVALAMETWTALPTTGGRRSSCEPKVDSTDHGQFRRTD